MTFGVRFGALVRRYREAQGLSAGELAAAALGDEAKRSRISELENGKVARPQAKTIDALVGYLAIPLEEVDACRTPVDPPPVEGLPPAVLENLALRFGVENPDAPVAELEGFLKEKAKDFKAMQARLDALVAKDARIANVAGAARGALDAGDFEGARALIEEARAIQRAERTLPALWREFGFCEVEADSYLLAGEVELAVEALEAGVALFGGVDKAAAAEAAFKAGRRMYDHGERFAGSALKDAIGFYEAALDGFDRTVHGVDWAKTQNNLGNALQRLGERESGTARLEAAVAAYEAALMERTREAVPLDWAMTQNNLGFALRAVGERESGTARLEAAVAAYEAALTEWTREAVPLDWATTQGNLASVAVAFFDKTGEAVRLAAAEGYARAARAVFAEAGAGHYVGMVDKVLAGIATRRGG